MGRESHSGGVMYFFPYVVDYVRLTKFSMSLVNFSATLNASFCLDFISGFGNSQHTNARNLFSELNFAFLKLTRTTTIKNNNLQ